jgi:hypothetical protein
VHLALIKYSVMRLALFVGSLLLLSLVGVRRSVLLVVLAGVISLALSYLLLRKQREEVALALSERVRVRAEHRQGIGQADADEEDAAAAITRTGTSAPPITPPAPTTDQEPVIRLDAAEPASSEGSPTSNGKPDRQ